MSLNENAASAQKQSPGQLPQGEALRKNIAQRRQRGIIWRNIYIAAIVVAIVALLALIYSIVNSSYSLVAVANQVDPDRLYQEPSADLTEAEIAEILVNLDNEQLGQIILGSDAGDFRGNTLRIVALENILNLSNDEAKIFLRDNRDQTVSQGLADYTYPAELADTALLDLTRDNWGTLLYLNASTENLVSLISSNILSDPANRVSLLASVEIIAPEAFPYKPFEDLTAEELGQVMLTSDSTDLRGSNLRFVAVNIFFEMSLDEAKTELIDNRTKTTGQFLKDFALPEDLAEMPILDLERDDWINIMTLNFSVAEMRDVVTDKILKPRVVGTWNLVPSLSKDKDQLRQDVVAKEESRAKALGQELDLDPAAIEFSYRWWATPTFLDGTYNTRPELAGIRTAIIGSLYMIAITVFFAFPIGVGAAVYLEEYASDHLINRIIKVNISNLAGVPSIVYGMLGLVIFVRALGDLTQGATVIAAGLTMGLLILPVIIINAQEAIRAVPNSLRQASYGLGATKWQTIWHHVLPNAIPGIMTGTILAISRAIGETAPLIVIGAATRITKDPTLSSKFTVLPIQIFHWTSEPDPAFRNVAAAAILILMVLLLTMNSIAIMLRNRFSQRF